MVEHWHASPIGAGRAWLRSPELAIEEQPWTPILYLEGPRPGAVLPEAGRMQVAADAVLLSTGPGIYLLVGPHSDATRLASDFDLAVDMSDAWSRLAVSGPRAEALLAKGSAIDLHPAHFPVGACAAAGFARLRTVLWKSGADRYELLVGRSHARSLWEWLADAAAEFGCVGGEDQPPRP